MDAQQWKKLVRKISQGDVVPIIGTRLLVGTDGETSLQGRVAQRLLQDCSMEVADALPPFRELNEAVTRLRANVDGDDLYDHVHDAIRAITEAPDFVTPAPIRQLAQITGFRLFVTLTSDELLARSLRQRCAVREVVHSPGLPTSETADLPRDWQTRAGEVHLLYLFGKMRLAPMFAIHDEDYLEYAHNVIANHVLPGFLAELRQRSLLFIGCNFPDWLSRFFLRATNPQRKHAWLIEQLLPEESLTYFLRSYNKQTEILSSASPVEFVADLHRYWMAEFEGVSQKREREVEAPVPPKTMFFISYSRVTDLPRAETLYKALLSQGVSEGEIWYDRHTVEPGQEYRERILEGIRTCRYFLPLLSRAANDRDQAFVFREWHEAHILSPEKNGEFIVPIVVDPDCDLTRYTYPDVREWTRKLDFGHAPEGVPDQRLQAKLQKLVSGDRERRGANDT